MSQTALMLVAKVGIVALGTAALGILAHGAVSSFVLMDLVCDTKLVEHPPGRQTKDALRGAVKACAIAGVLSVAAGVVAPP
jgi:hypothetical protein